MESVCVCVHEVTTPHHLGHSTAPDKGVPEPSLLLSSGEG